MTHFSAVYDLFHGPISYDFVTWLIRAKKEAGNRKLHVVIAPKEDGLGGFSRNWGNHDEHAARWRLWHICVASCPLAEATVTVAPSRKWAAGADWWPEGKAHFMGPLVEASRRGEKIPKLRATEAARRYVNGWLPKKFITITLRNQSTDPSRNSDREAWKTLDAEAQKAGYEVSTIYDSNDALAKGLGYEELDPDLRLAVYEHAAMNFIGNNGPQELLKFSGAPYRTVGIGLGGWAEHFRKYFGMRVGEQLPWAGPQQRIVYEPESAEVLIREFNTWHEATSTVRASQENSRV